MLLYVQGNGMREWEQGGLITIKFEIQFGNICSLFSFFFFYLYQCKILLRHNNIQRYSVKGKILIPGTSIKITFGFTKQHQ